MCWEARWACYLCSCMCGVLRMCGLLSGCPHYVRATSAQFWPVQTQICWALRLAICAPSAPPTAAPSGLTRAYTHIHARL